ncbi:cytochrome c biogenesis protein CcsA [Rhizosphaericola mali]|uniref:ABC transporter permease n=1 Tax=Rhizosphaericola mali TaxID=2545455 RepID=A0A5P2FXI0_9BACT|nr:cytochrome c biogenesis protein CcsA [Rhizosphaericola mali]QES87647.1 ABC transporter permease [Rhizosphaericola mali]
MKLNVKRHWWKILSVVLINTSIFLGFIMQVTMKPIVEESIRNYFFHPSLWFVMMIDFSIALVYSIKFLQSGNLDFDIAVRCYASTGIFFGIVGLLTGMFWANYTWGRGWVGDPKLISAAIALLIYSAYFVLRGSMEEIEKRAKVSAIYNTFSYAMLFPTIFILPRLTDSLHPGSSGNPALNPKDVDSSMFLVFWICSVPGWLMFSFWITSIRLKIIKLQESDLKTF